MTVEERAQQMLEDHREWTISSSEGQEELKARFVKRLCEQIEDCAIVADETAKDKRHTHSMNAVARLVGRRIRTLGVPRQVLEQLHERLRSIGDQLDVAGKTD